MTKKDNDPFGFNKAINWNKLDDPKVLKELEEQMCGFKIVRLAAVIRDV